MRPCQRLIQGLLFIFTAHFFPTGLLAQAGKLQEKDYPFYFVFNNEIRDVRDFSVLNSQMLQAKESTVFRSTDRKFLMVGSHHTRIYSKYDLSGKLHHSFYISDRTAVIAPWWTHYVYIKNNDLWSVDLDWETGKLTNDRQLTQLGTFSSFSGIGFAHWYEDLMVVLIGGVNQQCYLLHTRSGEIQQMIPSNDYCYTNLSDFHSPSGRYLWIKDQIIDLKMLTARQQNKPFPYEFWQNDSTVLLLNHNTKGILLEVTTGKDTPQFDVEMHAMQKEIASVQDRWLPGRWFSPSGQYFLFMERGNNGDRSLWIGDTQQRSRIQTGLALSKGSAITVQPPIFKWTSDGSFIYVNEGDPLKQGTWFYDIHRQTHKKITPYLAQTIEVMRKAGKVVFTANNQLFRVDANGENLKQLNTEPLGRWDQDLRPFLSE